MAVGTRGMPPGVAACVPLVFVKAMSAELPEKDLIMIGIGTGENLLQLTALGQFLIPLATGVLVLRRSASQTIHSSPA